MDCIIFDLDGTLADCRHRLHHVSGNNRNWKAFFEGIPDDDIHVPISALLECVHNAHADGGSFRPIFCSGRPEDYRKVTEEWIYEHCGIDAPLYMRKTGDFRKDAIIKLELLAQIRADGFNPILAIDDRPQVIDAWQSVGLPVLAVVAPHADSDHATQWVGETLLTVMVGPTGSGKSHWCEQNAHPGAVISSDRIRAELCGDFKDQSKNEEVFAAMHDVARVRLKHGLPVVLDATHIRRKDRCLAASLAPKGTRVRYVVVDRPMLEKRRDGGWRLEVPGLLDRHDQTFRSQLKDILAGDNLSNVDVTYVADH